MFQKPDPPEPTFPKPDVPPVPLLKKPDDGAVQIGGVVRGPMAPPTSIPNGIAGSE